MLTWHHHADLAADLAAPHVNLMMQMDVFVLQRMPGTLHCAQSAAQAACCNCPCLLVVLPACCRSLYAVAANCHGLTAITLGGYNEHVTDGGMTVLFDSCKQLTCVQLSSKLLKVTDASGTSLAVNCPRLTHAKLTRAMTDTTIKQLALSCKQLRELDLHRSCSVSCGALQGLLEASPQLSKLVLPQQLEVGSVVQAMSSRCCSLSMLEEDQLQVLALQH
jgi:hypothetical protein